MYSQPHNKYSGSGLGGILLVLGFGGAGVVYLIRKRISTSAVESIETMELSETGEPPE